MDYRNSIGPWNKTEIQNRRTQCNSIDIIDSQVVLSTIFGVIYGEFFGFPIFNVEFKGHLEHGILGIFGPCNSRNTLA